MTLPGKRSAQLHNMDVHKKMGHKELCAASTSRTFELTGGWRGA